MRTYEYDFFCKEDLLQYASAVTPQKPISPPYEKDIPIYSKRKTDNNMNAGKRMFCKSSFPYLILLCETQLRRPPQEKENAAINPLDPDNYNPLNHRHRILNALFALSPGGSDSLKTRPNMGLIPSHYYFPTLPVSRFTYPH